MPRTKVTARKSTGGCPPRVMYATLAPRRGVRLPQPETSDSDCDVDDQPENPASHTPNGLDAQNEMVQENVVAPGQTVENRNRAKETLRNLPGWVSTGANPNADSFYKQFIFRDMNQAFEFMSLVMVRCRTMSHPPDWYHVNTKVTVNLPSSESNGLSTKDSRLAVFMDGVAGVLAREN